MSQKQIVKDADLTEMRFSIIKAMLKNDEKLREKVKAYQNR